MEKENEKEVDLGNKGKPAFVVAYERDLEREQKLNAEGKTLADRLFNAVTNTVVEVKFTDNQGDFVVPIRRFTWSEQEQLLALAKQPKMEDEKATEQVNEKFFRLLAYPTGVCLSPELNMTFWKKGQYDYGLPVTILTAARNRLISDLSAAESFRKTKTRSVST